MLDGAPLERAANVAVYYSMLNAGQSCISLERVYAEAPIYDELLAKVLAKVERLRVGEPRGPGAVDIGAISPPRQLEIIESTSPTRSPRAPASPSVATVCRGPARSSSRR